MMQEAVFISPSISILNPSIRCLCLTSSYNNHTAVGGVLITNRIIYDPPSSWMLQYTLQCSSTSVSPIELVRSVFEHVVTSNSQTHTKSQRQGRGQNFQTANQAKSNIPLAHFKQVYWEESFHTVLRILNGRYQEQQANKAAIVLSILLDVSRYYTATMPQHA